MKAKMNLQSVKWFEVIFKNENEWSFKQIVADTMENACKIADDTFGKGTWRYVSEIN